MKKTIISFLFAVSLTANAQYVQYTPATTPSSSNTNPYRFRDPVGYIDDEMARYNYENIIVESEIINSAAISSATGNYYSIQVKSELRRNGRYSLKCIGIKMNNKWVSCESTLTSADNLYKQATTQSEKNRALELMEYASFVFTYNNTLYLIPKSE